MVIMIYIADYIVNGCVCIMYIHIVGSVLSLYTHIQTGDRAGNRCQGSTCMITVYIISLSICLSHALSIFLSLPLSFHAVLPVVAVDSEILIEANHTKTNEPRGV